MQTPEQKKIDLVICLTVMNYIYAISSNKLDKHDVICANAEVYECVIAIGHSGLQDCKIYDLQKFTSLKHALSFKVKNGLHRKEYFEYFRIFLSFPDGWHFAHLKDYINLNFKNIILLDDGIGNLTETVSRGHILKNAIASLCYGDKKIFSSGRNFHHHGVCEIATIYSQFLDTETKYRLIVNDVGEAVSRYIGFFANKYLPSDYDALGIYVQSDHGAYYKDKDKLIRYLEYNLKYLEDKTGIAWFVKSKATDPLRYLYSDHGIKLLDCSVNLELIYDERVKSVCTRFDTFALNSLIFNMDIKNYVRSDPSKNASDKKVEIVTKYASDIGCKLRHVPGGLDDH